MRHLRGLLWAIGAAVLSVECGGAATAPSQPVSTLSVAAPATVLAEYLVGAGDIGHCRNNDIATASLLDDLAGVVFTAGDNAYESGTDEEFARCYEPTWGRFKPRTRPAPGNHDYNTKGAAGYYNYFGASAGPDRTGYYSYDLGSWHILSLNSSVNGNAGSAQWNWVRSDLQASHAPCTLAYWHYPVFSSGYDGNLPHMRDIWALLYEAKAEVVVAAHAHDYERFAPMDAQGRSDEHGIRSFVVGTGGSTLTPLIARQPNSEVFNNETFGVIQFTLRSNGYDWRFLPIDGQTFGDAGSGTCF